MLEFGRQKREKERKEEKTVELDKSEAMSDSERALAKRSRLLELVGEWKG